MADPNDIETFVPTDKELEDFLFKASALLAGTAADFAPRGHSNQLKNSIRAERPLRIAGSLVGIVSSGAVAGKGVLFDYGLFQHDEKLRHFKGYPDQGYQAAGGKRLRIAKNPAFPRVAAYGRGYRRRDTHTKKFATKFMDKSMDEHADRLIKAYADQFN